MPRKDLLRTGLLLRTKPALSPLSFGETTLALCHWTCQQQTTVSVHKHIKHFDWTRERKLCLLRERPVNKGLIRTGPKSTKMSDSSVNHKLSCVRTDDISGPIFRPGQTNIKVTTACLCWGRPFLDKLETSIMTRAFATHIIYLFIFSRQKRKSRYGCLACSSSFFLSKNVG